MLPSSGSDNRAIFDVNLDAADNARTSEASQPGVFDFPTFSCVCPKCRPKLHTDLPIRFLIAAVKPNQKATCSVYQFLQHLYRLLSHVPTQ